MRNVRVGFEKVGLAKYISHLDLARCMGRAIKRAEIPVWYTEGFNQHLFMSFALPLSLGTESVVEYMDIKLLDDDMTYEYVIEKINNALPEGLKLTEIWEPVKKASLIEKSDYVIRLSQSNISAEQLSQNLKDFIGQESILVEKKTKKGITTIDLKPLIFNFNCEVEDESVKVYLKLPAGVHLNINPSLILDNFYKNYSISCKTDIMRVEVYDNEGNIFR